MIHQSPPGHPIVYWHRELPPVSAEIMGEHTVEAASARVEGTIAHRDELWDRCYEDLMERAGARLEQEVERLNGDFAHVLGEVIEARRDDASRKRGCRAASPCSMPPRAIPSESLTPGTGSGSVDLLTRTDDRAARRFETFRHVDAMNVHHRMVATL